MWQSLSLNLIFLWHRDKRARLQIHPRTPDPYDETSKRQFDGRVKAWRRELHKWDILDDIAKVPLQQQGNAKTGASEGVSRGRPSSEVQVLAPVLAPNSKPRAGGGGGALGSSDGANSNGHRSDGVASSSSNNNTTWAGEIGFEGAYGDEPLDSPAGKRARTGGGDVGIGEDLAALEGVDYDCEAPDDCDEDVL